MPDEWQVIPNLANTAVVPVMSTTNISLPDDMKAFVDEQVRINGFASTSEYMRALIREREDAIERLRARD